MCINGWYCIGRGVGYSEFELDQIVSSLFCACWFIGLVPISSTHLSLKTVSPPSPSVSHT